MENIKKLDMLIKGVPSRKNAVYFNDDFCIFDVLQSPPPEFPSKNSTYGFVLCLKGETQGTIDLLPCKLKAGGIGINIPGQLLLHTHSSPDFEGIGVVMSPHFVGRLGLPYDFELYNMVRDNPVLDLQADEFEAILIYCKMVRRLLETERLHQAETLSHLTCAYYYGINSYLFKRAGKKVLSNAETLVHRFLEELHKHYQKERKVTFYADCLHISPGYLSTIVAHNTGKSASEWIDNFVVLEAKALLKQTNQTIQQISDELNFPSQSFFGKFFKRMTGISPKEYREK